MLGPGAPSYVTLAALPSYAPALMYLSEEIAFPTNPGVSVGLIERGMRANLREGRYVYGGSTVTQQLVKNVFLRRDKTLARKLEELVLAWAVEQALPKERILELYLNVIEFGPEVWGFAAAARHYFDRDADALTPLEVAFLATLKPAPHEGRRIADAGAPTRAGGGRIGCASCLSASSNTEALSTYPRRRPMGPTWSRYAVTRRRSTRKAERSWVTDKRSPASSDPKTLRAREAGGHRSDRQHSRARRELLVRQPVGVEQHRVGAVLATRVRGFAAVGRQVDVVRATHLRQVVHVLGGRVHRLLLPIAEDADRELAPDAGPVRVVRLKALHRIGHGDHVV